MTNALIVSIYGQLVALTLELDKAITEKLDSRGFLPDSLIAQLAEEHARQFTMNQVRRVLLCVY
jgi:AICAR transformylase/IMP cyclohydrolase PurH